MCGFTVGADRCGRPVWFVVYVVWRNDVPGQAERASPFPTKVKWQHERETGRADDIRPYGTLFVVLTRNWRAACMPPLRSYVCCVDEEHEGGYYPPAAHRKAGGTVLPPAPLP